MMQLRLRHALVSWCSDLTDPAASSYPVAVLVVASIGNENFAAVQGFVGEEGPFPTDDEFTASWLLTAPDYIQHHVKQLIDREHPSDPDELLFSLRRSLRNSLHVSNISKPTVLDLPQPKGSPAQIRISVAVQERASATLHHAQQRAAARPLRASTLPPHPDAYSFSLWKLDSLEQLRTEQRRSRP